MYGVFVRLQRTQEIITILDNRAKFFLKISSSWNVDSRPDENYEGKNAKSFIQVHRTF